MALLEQEPEVDTLAHLEDRIQKAVLLVAKLRQERDAALKEKDAALKALAESQDTGEKLSAEIESLRAERQQVRGRLERLLDHIDQLGGA